MQHKKSRRVALGENANLYFENRLTIQYQIQEMLRVERIFDAAGINEELESYNPMIPNGKNLKATFMLEFPNIEERKTRLESLKGIEDKVFIQVAELDKVYPISDEDLERENEEKTSAVHFSRFEFNDEMIAALHAGAELKVGSEHENYFVAAYVVSDDIRASLLSDFS